MMQAIETRYLGATNTKGGRIVATTASGLRHVIGYPHELTAEAGHRKAATELAERLHWLRDAELVGGGTRRGYCFVLVGKDGREL